MKIFNKSKKNINVETDFIVNQGETKFKKINKWIQRNFICIQDFVRKNNIFVLVFVLTLIFTLRLENLEKDYRELNRKQKELSWLEDEVNNLQYEVEDLENEVEDLENAVESLADWVDALGEWIRSVGDMVDTLGDIVFGDKKHRKYGK